MEQKYQDLTLDEVISLFEHREYYVRRDFISEYHFNDEYHDYYYNFILKFNHTNDDLYFTDLIELAIDLDFVSDEFYDKYFRILKNCSNSLIKMVATDYFLYKEFDYPEKKYELISLYKELIKTKSTRHNVKFNLLLALLSIDRKNYSIYFEKLLYYFKISNHYQPLCRSFNSILETDMFFFIPESDIQKLIEASKTFAITTSFQYKKLEEYLKYRPTEEEYFKLLDENGATTRSVLSKFFPDGYVEDRN